MKSHGQSALEAMLKFNTPETENILKKITPKLEELTKQSEMFSAQVNLLDKKIEHLVVSAKPQHAQTEAPEARLYEIGAHPPAQKPCSDLESCVMMQHSGTQAVAWQTACISDWGNYCQLQQELQNLLDTSLFLLDRAIAQVDISPSRITQSLNTLMRADGAIDLSDIKTLDVWLAERKYQQIKSTVQTKTNQLMEQQHEKRQDIPVQAEDGRDIVSPTKQMRSELKYLLVDLLRIDAHDIPKKAAAGRPCTF